MRLNDGNVNVRPGAAVGQNMQPWVAKGMKSALNITAAATTTTMPQALCSQCISDTADNLSVNLREG